MRIVEMKNTDIRKDNLFPESVFLLPVKMEFLVYRHYIAIYLSKSLRIATAAALFAPGSSSRFRKMI